MSFRLPKELPVEVSVGEEPPQYRPALFKAGTIVLRSEVSRVYSQLFQYWPPNELMATFNFMMSKNLP